jgi:hypothetical protein
LDCAHAFQFRCVTVLTPSSTSLGHVQELAGAISVTRVAHHGFGQCRRVVTLAIVDTQSRCDIPFARAPGISLACNLRVICIETPLEALSLEPITKLCGAALKSVADGRTLTTTLHHLRIPFTRRIGVTVGGTEVSGSALGMARRIRLKAPWTAALGVATLHGTTGERSSCRVAALHSCTYATATCALRIPLTGKASRALVGRVQTLTTLTAHINCVVPIAIVIITGPNGKKPFTADLLAPVRARAPIAVPSVEAEGL